MQGFGGEKHIWVFVKASTLIDDNENLSRTLF